MAEHSKIEWTDATWTPIRARNRSTGKIGWHCEHKSSGCINCYAESMNLRLGTGLDFKPGHRKDIELFPDEKMLMAPLRWRRSRVVFVCSMTDLFASFVPDDWIDRIFAVMQRATNHTFQVLTKRPRRAAAYLNALYREAGGSSQEWFRRSFSWPLARDETIPFKNVWIGTSCEDQATADERIPHLLDTPAAVRFVSLEPLLGPIRIAPWLHDSTCEMITTTIYGCSCSEPREAHLDWVIVGGESGPGARPMHPAWARSIRDQCAAAGVPFFFKQWGEWASVSEVAGPGAHFHFLDGATVRRVGKKAAGRLLDGRTWDEMPGLLSWGEST